MDRPLHLLVVDDRPESVFLLSEFLLKRHHRVAVSSDAREALAAILRRSRSGEPYDLVFANARLRELDGVGLLRELRAQRDPTALALIDPDADIDALTYREAESLGCLALLEKPIDLSRVEQLLGQVRPSSAASASAAPIVTPAPALRGSDQYAIQPRTTAAHRYPSSPMIPASETFSGPRPTTKRGRSDEPFFGTGRVASPARGSERLEQPGTHAPAGPYAHPQQPPGPAPANPFTESFPAHLARDTSRIRRSVSGRGDSEIAAGGTATPPPAGSGSGSRGGALERRIVCAACRKEFLVAHRGTEFTVNCVHCGQLNRVQPRAR